MNKKNPSIFFLLGETFVNIIPSNLLMHPLGGAQTCKNVWRITTLTRATFFPHVSLGEDMAYEPVHYNPAVVYCTLVGGEVYCGVPGFPLYPHHDRAAAQTHPY